MPDPTDAEVEWAAECLWRAANTGRVPEFHQGCAYLKEAAHALAHGYRPPPRPRSVRDDVRDTILAEDEKWQMSGMTMPKAGEIADAILARFEVRRKDV